jgi:large subunit ribosomal protein L9
MRIVLQKEVEKLGVPGDVVDVADGYARNYLIPRKLAVRATRGGVKHAESMKQAHEARVEKAVAEARELSGRLTASPLRLGARAGEDGRLFGSITANHVADELQRVTGVDIDKRRINLPDPIRSVGTHEVQVHLHPEVEATVTVEVVAQ